MNASSRDTMAALGELQSVMRRPTAAEAFYIPTGHYQVDTISGPVRVEGPIWTIFDAEGHPYPCAPSVFEKTWDVIDPATVALAEEYRAAVDESNADDDCGGG